MSTGKSDSGQYGYRRGCRVDDLFSFQIRRQGYVDWRDKSSWGGGRVSDEYDTVE